MLLFTGILGRVGPKMSEFSMCVRTITSYGKKKKNCKSQPPTFVAQSYTIALTLAGRLLAVRGDRNVNVCFGMSYGQRPALVNIR